MSKIIISAAIRGAHKIVDKCAAKFKEAWRNTGRTRRSASPIPPITCPSSTP